eukprot:c8673_g1_i1.p1 GENE.c8673_g1_i1~~c8673_g1_i1.p1  ORF type:complete len:157 (+),score=14.81 c8673_g1_i1:52-471(+)
MTQPALIHPKTCCQLLRTLDGRIMVVRPSEPRPQSGGSANKKRRPLPRNTKEELKMKKLLTKRAKSWERALSLFSSSASSFHFGSSVYHKDSRVMKEEPKCDASLPKYLPEAEAPADCLDVAIASSSPPCLEVLAFPLA